MVNALTAGRSGLYPWPKQFAIGSLFWLCVLLALEPGNLLRWHGIPPSWDREALRLGMASLLGGSCGPAIFWLVTSHPMRRARVGYILLTHAVTIGALTLILLTLANIMAWLFLQGPGIRHLPLEVAANLSLLVAGLTALDIAVHLISPAAKHSDSSYVSHVTIKDKSGRFQLPLVQVERLEAQENYVALHTGVKTHLVRMTLSSLAARLNPEQFIRIHRSGIVNRACILKVKPIGNGKMQIALRSGSEAITSRAYSDAFRADSNS